MRRWPTLLIFVSTAITTQNKFLPDNSKYRVKYGINNNFKFLHFLKWTHKLV
jgi:hypothetical protein